MCMAEELMMHLLSSGMVPDPPLALQVTPDKAFVDLGADSLDTVCSFQNFICWCTMVQFCIMYVGCCS
jgi:hypothetical protein